MSSEESATILKYLQEILTNSGVQKYILVVGDQDSHDAFNIFHGPKDWLEEVALGTLKDIHDRDPDPEDT